MATDAGDADHQGVRHQCTGSAVRQRKRCAGPRRMPGRMRR
jgi:hypothetical protein